MKPLINLDHVKVWQKTAISHLEGLSFHSFNWKDGDYIEIEPLSSAEVEKNVKAYFQGKYLYDQLFQLRQLCIDILGGKLPQMRAEWNEAMDPEPFDPFEQIEWLFDNNEQPEALPPAIKQYAELRGIMKEYRERDPKKKQEVLAALKYYNKFYARVHAIIKLHRKTKSKTKGVKSCARKILMLFEVEEQSVENHDGIPLNHTAQPA